MQRAFGRAGSAGGVNDQGRIIYSDSRTAIGWVRKKHCNTKLAESEVNKPLFEMIRRAEQWLRTHAFATRVVKWETTAWGEIPADFGRK